MNDLTSSHSVRSETESHLLRNDNCYDHKDGSQCPIMIDGEAVNPLWGITKAGKARKRLPQACLSCRSKKVKCELYRESCSRCRLSGQRCQMPHAASAEDPSVVREPRPEPHHPMLVLPDSQKSWTATSTQASRSQLSAPSQQYLKPSIDCWNLQYRLQTGDPYLVDPEATSYFLKLFFVRTAGGLGMLFPETSFIRWVQTSPQKRQDECFVLYVILGLGSLSATTEFGRFAEHCTESLRKMTARLDGNFGVAAMHARLLLAHYHYALGNDNMGWELSGCALTAMRATRLSCEQESQGIVTNSAQQVYGLSQVQLVECQRRLFWAAFLLDRQQGLCHTGSCDIQLEDIQLRLPCNAMAYDEQMPSEAQVLDGSLSNLGVYLLDMLSVKHSPDMFRILLAAICTEILEVLSLGPRRKIWANESHDSRVENLRARLYAWRSSLPPRLIYSKQALLTASRHGQASEFVDMHAMYEIAHLRLARNANHKLLRPSTIVAQIRAAHLHASQLLAMVLDLHSCAPSKLSSQAVIHDDTLTNLFPSVLGQGVTSAIDVLSAGGHYEDFLQVEVLLQTAILFFKEQSKRSSRAKLSESQTARRLAEIRVCASSDLNMRDTIDPPRASDTRHDIFWRLKVPMEKLRSDQDVIYENPHATHHIVSIDVKLD